MKISGKEKVARYCLYHNNNNPPSIRLGSGGSVCRYLRSQSPIIYTYIADWERFNMWLFGGLPGRWLAYGLQLAGIWDKGTV
jgi:hypothetical protein